MRFFKAVILLVLGLLLGAALGYAALTWLQSRSSESAGERGVGEFPGLVDRLHLRIQEAIDEGKRAAAAARAELEREAYGRPDRSPGSEAEPDGVI